jgi:hypothetical protein
MSLINDALKQARKAPPRNTPSAVPPLQPAPDDSPVPAWLLPSIVIFLIVAAIFFIGWAVAHNSVRAIASAPPSSTDAVTAPLQFPVATPRPVEPPPPPLNPPDAPKLQGIFYSPTDPSAIVNGKIVHQGDKFSVYTVKAITKYTVTLSGPDKKEIQIGMDN